MAKVRIVDVTVLDNPSKFFNPFQFQITFECTEDLSDGKHPIYIFDDIYAPKKSVRVDRGKMGHRGKMGQ